MASRRCNSRPWGRFAHDATPLPRDEDLDVDELTGDRAAPGVDPHYVDLPCYVALINDDGLDPSAWSCPCPGRDGN